MRIDPFAPVGHVARSQQMVISAGVRVVVELGHGGKFVEENFAEFVAWF